MKEQALADKFKMQQLKLERNLLAAVKQQRTQAKVTASSKVASEIDWVP